MDTTTTRLHPGVILALVCGAQFMVVLDIAIVNVALPSIQQDLDVSQSTLQWVVIAYGLMLGGFLLLGGRMADLLGRRRIFLDRRDDLLGGVARRWHRPVVVRADHGTRSPGFRRRPRRAGGAVDPRRHLPGGAAAQPRPGIFGAVGGTSASVGVIASGLLTDGPGWRWVFFINVPVGVVLIGLAAAFLAADHGVRAARGGSTSPGRPR